MTPLCPGDDSRRVHETAIFLSHSCASIFCAVGTGGTRRRAPGERRRDRHCRTSLAHPHRPLRRGDPAIICRQPLLRHRPNPRDGDQPRPLHRARFHHPGSHAGAHGRGRRALPEARRQDRGIPFRRVPARTAPRQQHAQPEADGQRAGSDAGPEPRPRRDSRGRGGARTRQRRTRPPGGLLHGIACHARDPGHRLRYPLRVRHLRADDQGWLAGRGCRRVAAQRQSLGAAAPASLPGQVWRSRRALPRRRTPRARALGARFDRLWHRLRHATTTAP